MEGHDHAAGLRHGDDPLEEVGDVLPQALLSQLAVGPDQVPDLVLGIAGVPAGEVDVVLQGVQALHLLPVHDQAGGAVLGGLVQLVRVQSKTGMKL